MKKFVYADNSATTQVSKEVLDSMISYFNESYGNPSSVYDLGKKSKKAIEEARVKVANSIKAKSDEIFFTSCATESNNWAIKGAMSRLIKNGKNHFITTTIEHHSVLHIAEHLEKNGVNVTYVPVDEYGIIKLEELKKSITEQTAMVSVIFANNEIGTIQPIKEIGEICKNKGILFHTDAVQAIGKIKIDVNEMNIDLLSISGHKFHAPKGIGALYIRNGVKIDSILHGGAQERKKRAGTENVASIVGMGIAIENITNKMDEVNTHTKKLSDKLIDGLSKIPKSRLNGSRDQRLSNNVNMSFEGVEGESLLLMLSAKGICASSGSACTSGSLDPSHVLMAIGLEHMVAHGSLRFSFSEYNTEQDIDYILEQLPNIVSLLRSMSPVWETIKDN